MCNRGSIDRRPNLRTAKLDLPRPDRPGPSPPGENVCFFVRAARPCTERRVYAVQYGAPQTYAGRAKEHGTGCPGMIRCLVNGRARVLQKIRRQPTAS